MAQLCRLDQSSSLFTLSDLYPLKLWANTRMVVFWKQLLALGFGAALAMIMGFPQGQWLAGAIALPRDRQLSLSLWTNFRYAAVTTELPHQHKRCCWRTSVTLATLSWHLIEEIR